MNPASDVETIRTELVLADLGTIERAMPRLEKEAKNNKAAVAKIDAPQAPRRVDGTRATVPRRWR